MVGPNDAMQTELTWGVLLGKGKGEEKKRKREKRGQREEEKEEEVGRVPPFKETRYCLP